MYRTSTLWHRVTEGFCFIIAHEGGVDRTVRSMLLSLSSRRSWMQLIAALQGINRSPRYSAHRRVVESVASAGYRVVYRRATCQ